MEILNEQRAAKYWGCDFYHPCDAAPFKYRGVRYCPDDAEQKFRPVLYGDWSGGTNPNLACESHSDWNDVKVLLTPLSAITDEHAIEVAKIASIGKYEAKECIGCDKDDYKTIGKYIVADFNYPTYIDVRIHTDKYIKIIDLLRSLGYDCDNAISEGWAVDKTTM